MEKISGKVSEMTSGVGLAGEPLIGVPELKRIDGFKALARRDYAHDSIGLAQSLVGKYLFYRGVILRVTETEAYRGSDDPASHAYRGKTKRNAAMFAGPGHLYVYLSYGMHHCINAVGQEAGGASGVLIRSGAVASIARDGARSEISVATRRPVDLSRSAIGPGRLGRLVGARREDSGYDLCRADGEIFFFSLSDCAVRLHCSPRIGVGSGVEKQWRFFEADSSHLSGGGSSRLGAPLGSVSN